MSEWISVKERLPEPETMVLVYTGYPFGSAEMSVDIRYYDPAKYQPAWPFVTHWMPLPEPPKEDKKV